MGGQICKYCHKEKNEYLDFYCSTTRYNSTEYNTYNLNQHEFVNKYRYKYFNCITINKKEKRM